MKFFLAFIGVLLVFLIAISVITIDVASHSDEQKDDIVISPEEYHNIEGIVKSFEMVFPDKEFEVVIREK